MSASVSEKSEFVLARRLLHEDRCRRPKLNAPLSCFASQIALASGCDQSRGQGEGISDPSNVLASVKQCRRLTGLSGHEILLGPGLSPRHHATLRRYFRRCHGDSREVQEMLIHDLRSYLEIGARGFAADQLIVLRLFLAQSPLL